MYIGPWAATHGYVPPRRPSSAHPTIVPFQNFEASDGWLVVGAAKQKFWERLCDVIGHPELNEDPRFATMAGRNEHRDELLPVLEKAFSSRPVDAWVEALVEAGVPASRVNSVEEALADPQTLAREDVVAHDHPALGRVRSIRTPLRIAQDGVSAGASAGPRPVPRRAHRGGARRHLRLRTRARRRAGPGRRLRRRRGARVSEVP